MDDYTDLVDGVKQSLSLAGDRFEEEFHEARQRYNTMVKEAQEQMNSMMEESKISKTASKEGVFVSNDQLNQLLNGLQSITEALTAIVSTQKQG